MKALKLVAMIALAVAPLGATAHAQDDQDDIGACYQWHRFGPSQKQCTIVERRECFGSLTIGTRFVKGGDCSE